MSKLLFDSPPLVVQAELAVLLGLTEAIILQQVHYWSEKNVGKSDCYHDGHYWTYRSIKDWQKEDFPFWSEKTIERTFKKLEDRRLLVSGNYNRIGFDRTKWYRIDHDSFDKIGETIPTKCLNECRQNAEMNADKMSGPIQETNKDIINICAKDETETQVPAWEENFEKLWVLYPEKRGKGQVSQRAKKELNKAGFENVKAAIDRYLRYKKSVDQFLCNGSTFFNSTYKEYLSGEAEESASTPKSAIPDSRQTSELLKKLREGAGEDDE